MRVFVAGLWHLGCVTAACLAKSRHEIIAYDANSEIIQALHRGQSPIFESGLDELLNSGRATGKLTYTSLASDVKNADVVWVTYDTPVDENDIADVDAIKNEIETLFSFLADNTLVIISSQIPVGTTRELLDKCKNNFPGKNINFACIPENLRLGKAIDVFTHPDRLVVGVQNDDVKHTIEKLLSPFTSNLIWMSIESAEMTKHALNAFLATSVTFINELAMLCEGAGANAREVELGLKSDERIGAKAYLRPGSAIAGGTLARDVNYLIQIGQKQKRDTLLFSAILESNHAHKQWSCRRIKEILKNLKNKTITTLGLTYKAGTSTLRRSEIIETCQWLAEQGANVVAYDPVLTRLPTNLKSFIELKSSIEQALCGADAVVIATDYPQFAELTADNLLANINHPVVFDPSGFLFKKLSNDKRIQYFSVGI